MRIIQNQIVFTKLFSVRIKYSRGLLNFRVFREALARAFRVPVCLPQTAGLSAVQTFGKGRQAIGIKQGRHEESRDTTFSHNDGIALKAALAARQTAGLSCIARQR